MNNPVDLSFITNKDEIPKSSLYYLSTEYKSQWGQDKFLEELFRDISGDKLFVDVGAHDGVTLSNSYLFRNKDNWRCIMFEPNRDVYRRLTINRHDNQRNFVSDLCIGDFNGETEFLACNGYTEMLSGVYVNYDKQHLERISSESKEHGSTATIYKVPVRKLETIFTDSKIQHVSVLSIDTEGSELQVLRSIDFSKVIIDVILIEFNYPDSQSAKDIVALLKSKLFYHLATLGGDYVYVRSDFEKSKQSKVNIDWKVLPSCV